MNYFDLQVNGYRGVDFNGDAMTLERVAEACQSLQSEGVQSILATVITDDLDAMCRRLSQLASFQDQEPIVREVIHGFHIEGPFLNEQPGYIGAHPAAAAKPANLDDTQRLLDAACGRTRVFTLAPERDNDYAVIRHLSENDIVVSAGHCNPSYEQLQEAIAAGLRMFTHLGNGCPLEMHRHNNIIQRALHESNSLWIGFIVDGVHIPFFALRNYLAAAGLDRCFVVTDAISAAGLGAGTFQLAGQTVVVDEHLATWAADRSHLTGSAGTMPRSEMNLREHLQLSDADIEALLWHNPRKALGIV